MSQLPRVPGHLTGVKLQRKQRMLLLVRGFQIQIGQLVSETDFLNLYVGFCYF